MAIRKTDTTLDVNGIPVKAYLAAPENDGPGVLVLHSWWGLNPFFKQVCDQLSEQGFLALAADLYHGPVATSIDDAKALVEAADNQLMEATIMAAKDFLLAHPARTGAKLGALGFSMGASWALTAATRVPEQFEAVVSFYGAAEADFGKLQAKFMGHFSDADEWEELKWVNWMEGEMKTAGVDTTFIIYKDLPHWFVETDRPEYRPEAAALAWERTFAFLKENLG